MSAVQNKTHAAQQTHDTHFLEVPGGTIAYDDAGSGTVVICVPSIGDVRGEYRFLRPQLVEAGFRAVSMDIRGHGESSAGFSDYSSPAIGSDIMALARHLNAGPVAVIGTSMAAGSAAWAAAQAPDLISRLVLVGPFVRDHSGQAMLRLVMNALPSRPWGPAMWSWYFPKFFSSTPPADLAEYRARLKANLKNPGRVEALRAMMNRSDAPVEAALANITAPTLIVMGTKDPDFKDPATEARWIAGQVRGTILLIEGAGHYPQVEAPEQFGPQVIRFLRGADAA